MYSGDSAASHCAFAHGSPSPAHDCTYSSPVSAATAPNPAFLVRQYLFAGLDDRLALRPFLSPVEKRWVAFQLLHALQQLHEAGFCHGDIKSENVMVTSWNWVMLTDMAPFKPTYIPEDDPADFAFFFGGSQGGGGKGAGPGGQQQLEGRKCCCVAPERFFSERRSAGDGPSSASASAPGMLGMAVVPDSTLALADEEEDAAAAAAVCSRASPPGAGVCARRGLPGVQAAVEGAGA